jgi:leucyl-tRNA---protein transferase
MELELFEANNGNCPYLEGKQWHSYTFKAAKLDNTIYESLLAIGFRRSGRFFYKNNCPGCQECVPVRVAVNDFEMSRSQRRTWKKNQDVTVRWHPVEFDEESYDLYQTYSIRKHESETNETNYWEFLVNSAVDTIMMKYYLEEKLIGVGWVDLLPRSLSSVYFAYDLDFSKRRLGIFSVLKEMELAREMNRPFLHLGFWVKDCPAMSYKQQFSPHELLINDVWSDPEKRIILAS